MTTPTQAQIEAAEGAMCDLMNETGGEASWQRLAKAALTAAAEAGKENKMDIEDCDGDLAEIEQIAESRANIAAAAELELPTADDVKGILKPDWLHPATIERCAQMAEKCAEDASANSFYMKIATAIAAAIRALKEEK